MKHKPILLNNIGQTQSNIDIGIERSPMIHNTPIDYKKKVAFIGHSKAGSTSLICWISNVLSQNKIKTAVIDLTQNKDLYEIYPFTAEDEDIKSSESKQALKELLYGNKKPYVINKCLHLYTVPYNVSFESIETNDFIKIIHLIEYDYDCVLIDADYDVPLEVMQVLSNLFIVQTLDAKGLKYNTKYQMLLKNTINMKKVKYVVNQVFSCNIKPKDIVDCLKVYTDIDSLEHTEIIEGKVDSYFVPFNQQALINSYVNEYNLDKLDDEFIHSIKNIANDIYPFDTTESKNIFVNKFFNKLK